MKLRDWLSLTACLTVSGILIIGLGMPLAWRIDRASYSWAAEDDYYELPSYEVRPAPKALVDADFRPSRHPTGGCVVTGAAMVAALALVVCANAFAPDKQN